MRYLSEQTSTTAYIQYPEASQGATHLTPTMHSQQVITGGERSRRNESDQHIFIHLVSNQKLYLINVISLVRNKTLGGMLL